MRIIALNSLEVLSLKSNFSTHIILPAKMDTRVRAYCWRLMFETNWWLMFETNWWLMFETNWQRVFLSHDCQILVSTVSHTTARLLHQLSGMPCGALSQR
jgi:hypothetical protein